MGTDHAAKAAQRSALFVGVRRLLLVGLGLWVLPATASVRSAPERPPAGEQPLFNQADYDLAWQAFLGAGKLTDAIVLAQKALLIEPDSVLWHRRLASAAEQDGQAALAAVNYAWLATQGHQDDLLAHAIDLASATQQGDLAIQLMQARALGEPFNLTHWDQLIASMLNIGRFDQALADLSQADGRQPRRYFLQQQADILAVAGRTGPLQAVLRQLVTRYGADPQTNLQLASSEYLQGHLQQALATLRQAQDRATPADTVYWQTLGSLAWMLQDFPVAGAASRVLMRAGMAATVDYMRLYRIHAVTEPAVAYAYALSGWRQTRADPLFFAAAAAATRLDQPALLQALFDSVRPVDRLALEAQSSFWVQWAQLARSHGNDRLARARYLQALKRDPVDTAVFAGFIWLLIDTQDQQMLRSAVTRAGPATAADPDLRDALTAALAVLDQPTHALASIRPDLASHGKDPDRIMQYADLLDQDDQNELAQAMRRSALAPLRRLQAARALTRQQQLQRLALLTRLAPGDPAARGIAELLRHPIDRAARELVLAWTLELNNAEATALWLAHQFASTPAPLWARLSQSLGTDDDSTTRQLLLTEADRMPRRDRVTAAEKLGWTGAALSFGYHGLQDQSDDRRLAMQWQDLALTRSDMLGTSLGGLHGGGVRTLESGVNWRHWLTPRWSLEGELHRVRQLGDGTQQLDQIPAHGQSASAMLVAHFPRGEAGILLGGGRNLGSYTRWGAFSRYRLTRNLQLGAYADVGARTDDTVPLAMVGLTDRLKSTAEYQWTARDSVSATATLARLRAQGGGRLGGRQSLDLEYRHKLWLAPPDFTLIASATRAEYQRASSVPAAVRRLLPAAQVGGPNVLVPLSYSQLCAGVAFNENYRDDWSGHWRPFGSVSACQNSVSGVGVALNAGFGAPLSGPDHLSIQFGYSTNTGATGGRNLNMLLNYRYYFTP
ncbi:tetratricopeptide repeat protein [Rhodanobacter sp. AS-Z3]|uniref:tetratricopeptide repeat protein n=1 Tax=Rhodanobacter sp. AS-Z3 TaxID=3031330 RepID=UPI00247ACBF9|nr:tetratricopeptide repeat protein [Rhodanobacter sp. AS-Z3]WEN15820.1 tetratricopeptide repeat protein [Rhodanobacter sp. AS-Z3]